MSIDFEQLISDSLQKYDTENDKYYKPTSYEDWLDEWDFKNYDPNIYKHGLHQYPARFIPQLARKLLRVFADKDSTVLDIFSGSGTTMLECTYLGIKKAIGIELNPFAIFMTKVKTTYVDSQNLWADLNAIQELYNNPDFDYQIITFKNIEVWYTPQARKDLSKLFAVINRNANIVERNFFLLCFSEICRKDSYLHHNGFKMYRSRQKLQSDYKPDVLKDFLEVANRNIKLNEDSNTTYNTNSETLIIQGDTRVYAKEIEPESVDFILTSPPYGDSRTTVAYGQYSRLPWQWITQADDIITLDNQLLGGKPLKSDDELLEKSKTLKEQYSIIKNTDEKRARDVISFYSDLYKTMENAEQYLKKGKLFVLVTGNRTVKKVTLQTDSIISEFGDRLGFSTLKILSRNILNKRMAMKNSPTNVPGDTVNTMLKESIIFLQKN